MTTSTAPSNIILPAVGSPFEGGFYAGQILIAGAPHALIVALKSGGGEFATIAWHNRSKAVQGALSFSDGLANTRAMAKAGSRLATQVVDLRIAGFDDWYLPARDELEILYRAFKPTADQNWCWRGDNPNSIPAGEAYMPDAPAQTSIEAFRGGGPEAFESTWYWSSTQYAGIESDAWAQHFDA
ncbi:MAG TPA: DUF1566 domain-containing protein, partial [Burkholderiaceae bacterium]|nr:DUF1566 domain-containing protein [Burkholderiaceae bacterium]